MSNSTRAIGRALVVLLVLVAFIVTGLWLAIGGSNGGNDTKPAANPSGSASGKPTDEPTDETCPARFVQKDISDKKLARFIKGGIDAKTAKKSTNKLLTAVGQDASTLRFYAEQFGIKDLPTEAEMLNADGTCLSEVGRQVHHDLTVVMNASGQKFGEAPTGAWNTGVDKNGNPVVDSQPGIGGNRKAVVYTLPDGTKVIILVRCGNPALPKKPDLPPGDTDNPPPCNHNCNPPPKCPPGQVGTPPDCLTPKDANEGTERQGNNRPGGGGKAPKQTDPVGPPKGGKPPKTYNPPDPPKSSNNPPKGSTPTPQPSNPPATGVNDGDDGGTIDQPDW